MISHPNRGRRTVLAAELLKDDLHAVRSTIEAYSRKAEIHGRQRPAACGYDLRKGSAQCALRAMVSGSWQTYNIDRWD